MSFRYERELVGTTRDWLRSRGLLVKAEYPTPWGVCDLVGAELDEARVRARLELRHKRPIGPALRVAILLRIPDVGTGRAITVRALGRQFGGALSDAEIKAEVDRLLASRFVKPVRRRAVQSVSTWMPLERTIVAVELKMARVREALRQAVAHRQFADESYVGLPRGVAERIREGERRRVFEEAGVGLLGVSAGSCELIVDAARSPRRADPVARAHCAERFWRMALRGSSA